MQENSSRYSNADHYKALRDDYKTPPHIYEPILKYFKMNKFDIDVCCTDKNIPAEKYYTKEDDGLAQKWKGLCFKMLNIKCHISIEILILLRMLMV